MMQDLEVVNMCLGALKALASYHYREMCAGKTGLGSHAAGQGNLSEGIFSRFLHSLLQLLLFEDYRYLEADFHDKLTHTCTSLFTHMMHDCSFSSSVDHTFFLFVISVRI